MKVDDLDNMPWLSPAQYASRPTRDLSILVARDIAMGGHPYSVANKYGIRHYIRDWLRRGMLAAKRDAGQFDTDAAFLEFYLIVSQGMGLAQVEAEQYNHANAPQWWISHNSESSAQWAGTGGMVGAGAEGSVLASAEVVESAKYGGGVSLAPPATLDVRAVMRTIIESGAVIPPSGATGAGADSSAARDPSRSGTTPEGDNATNALDGTGTDG